MKRLLGLIVGLTALVLVAGIANAKMDDKEWASVKGDLTAKINNPDPKIRATAIGPLADADRKEAVQLLLGLLHITDSEAITLEDEKDKYLEKIGKLGLVPPADATAHNGWKAELKRLEDLKRAADEKITADRELHMAIIEGLAKTTDADAVKWLAANGLKSNLWTDRAGIAEVFGFVKNPEATQGILDLLAKERDPRVIVACVDSLGKIGDKRAVPLMVKVLQHEAWQARAAAAEALAKSLDKGAVEPLIHALEKEQSPRPKSLLIEALTRLTGEAWGADIVTWKKWWADHKDTWAGPKAAPKVSSGGGGPGDTKTVNDFFGIPIDSDRLIFILDISGSMDEEYEVKGASVIVSGGDGKGPQGPEPFKGTKLRMAQNELIKCIKKLDPKATFNIIFFNNAMEQWKKDQIPASPANKEEAIKYVEKQTASSQTNIWDPLETAFKMAGMGLNDKQYKANIDTIFLLSDGSPYPPDLFVQSAEIIKRTREYNKLKKLRINTIAVGSADTHLMETLAKESGGKYVKR